MCNLLRIQDISYATALEVTAGGRLYNVVVDTESTAKKLLQNGQLQSRATFIPLNKIEGRSIEDRTTSVAKKLVGDENCHTALSLIDYNRELEPAMKFIYGNSFVCRNLQDARKVTFHQQIQRKAVTLGGDIVDPGGTLTGGSRAAGSSVLSKLNDLQQYRAEYEDKSNQLTSVEHKLREFEQSAAQYRSVKQRFDVKKTEYEMLQQRLQQTLHHKQVQEVENINAELQKLCETSAEATNVLDQGRKRIKELEDQIKNSGAIREKQLQQATAELERCKKKAAASQAKWKEQSDDANSLKLEVEELKKSIETTQAQIEGNQLFFSNAEGSYFWLMFTFSHTVNTRQ